MPKFITYQRPAPVNKGKWAGRPGAPPMTRKEGKKLPTLAPEAPAAKLPFVAGTRLPDHE